MPQSSIVVLELERGMGVVILDSDQFSTNFGDFIREVGARMASHDDGRQQGDGFLCPLAALPWPSVSKSIRYSVPSSIVPAYARQMQRG